MRFMKPISPIKPMMPMSLIAIMLIFSLTLSAQTPETPETSETPETPETPETSETPTRGPIIKGNVYGGGNQGNVVGNSTVTVKAGDIGDVYGGARMADVGGRTFVNLDGEHASADILIRSVYGGNDIAGNIGNSGEETDVPQELDHVLKGTQTQEEHPMKNAIDNTWKTFVRSSRSTKTVNEQVKEKFPLVAGSVFGGGNGNYYYDPYPDQDGNYYVYLKEGDKDYIATRKTPFNKPELAKTYLELTGGLLAHVYGGGNFATVTENTTICIDDKSDDLITQAANYAADTGYPTEDVIQYLIAKVELPTFQSNFTHWDYHFARVFGGNNKADMAIQPVWNLQRGKIRDLYSGGNNGRMTHPNGLLLDIHPSPQENIQQTDSLKIENVYGGCRMADVRPKTDVWDDNLYNPVTDDNGDYKYVDQIDKM